MDIITYALCKKLIGQASSSIKDIKYNSSTKSLVFTTETGSFSVPVPVPADGVGVKNIYFNNGGDLVFEYTDGNTTNVGNIFQGTTDIEEIELYPDFTEEDNGAVLTVENNTLSWSKDALGVGEIRDDVSRLDREIDEVSDEIFDKGEASPNILNPNSVIRGSISTSTGAVTESDSGTYMITDFIDVSDISNIYLYRYLYGTTFELYGSFRTFFYNEDKSFTASGGYVDGAEVSIPSTKKYVRLRLAWSYWTNPDIKYEAATTPQTEYKEYGDRKKIYKVVKFVNGVSPTDDGNVQISGGLSEIYSVAEERKNLLTNIIEHSYVDDSGTFKNPSSTSSAYAFCRSDYIPVIPNKRLYMNNKPLYARYFAFYDENKAYIGGKNEFAPFDFHLGIAEKVMPSNAYYIIVSFATKEDADNAWITWTGSAPDGKTIHATNEEYVDYHYYPSNPCDYNGDDISVFNKILCIGDSITSGYMNTSTGGQSISKYSYPSHLAKMTGVETVNLGDAGQTSVTWWERHADFDYSGFDCCIINLGINDKLHNVSETDTRAAFANILNAVKTANKGIKIFMANVNPAYARGDSSYDAINAVIKDIAESTENVYFIDLTQYGHSVGGAYQNGHLTALGYRLLAQDYKSAISHIIKNQSDDFKWVQFIGTDLVG